MKKFSSFLYNDSPVVTENPASASGRFSSQDEGTEIKVDNDLNSNVEVVTFNIQVSRHLLTQLENCDSTISDNFTSELDSLRGIKAGCFLFDVSQHSSRPPQYRLRMEY